VNIEYEFTLGDAFDLQMGKTPARNNPLYWGGGNKWIAIADIKDKFVSETKECISNLAVKESKIKVVPKGTLIMSFKLSVGKIAFTAEDMYTNEAIMAFIDKGKYPIDMEYLFHYLGSQDWQTGTNKAVKGLTLNKKTLSTRIISLPSLDTQKEVAYTLNLLDRAIRFCHQILEDVDGLAKSRFVEMFGDPVNNPMGWKTAGLLDLGKCKNGMNYSNGENGVEVHCLGVGDFKDLSIISDTSILPMVSLNGLPSAEYMLCDGDIVFVRSNGNKALVGRSLIVYPHDVPTIFSGFCIRFRKTSDEILGEYLLNVLKTNTMRKKMVGRGANIQNLNQRILASLKIPLPPISMQQDFVAFCTDVRRLKDTIITCLQKVEYLKAALMQQYFG